MGSKSSYISEKTVFHTIMQAYENNKISLGGEVKLIVECLAADEEIKDQLLILTDVLSDLIASDEDVELIGIVSDGLHLMIREEYL